MIRDNVTGLVWEKKTASNGAPNYVNIHDADNTYTWCNTDTNTNGGNSGTCGVNDTMDFIAAMNNSVFGGYTDWRLPTISELAPLADLSLYNPAIDTTYFPNTLSLPYWSATTWSSLSTYAWYVTFDSGIVWNNSNTKDNSYNVRAVRGGNVPPANNRFVDNQNGTVIDTWTCLQWQQNTADTNGNGSTDTADTVLWTEALAYAENLTLTSHNDWRLPNLNELRSLVDFSRSAPTIDTSTFPDTQPSQYWSSTSGSFGPINAWTVSFNGGNDNASDKDGITSHRYVRSVRGKQCSTFSWPMFLQAITGPNK